MRKLAIVFAASAVFAQIAALSAQGSNYDVRVNSYNQGTNPSYTTTPSNTQYYTNTPSNSQFSASTPSNTQYYNTPSNYNTPSKTQFSDSTPSSKQYYSNTPSTSTGNQATSTQINPTQPITQPSNLPANYSEKKFAAWTDEDIAQKIRWAIRDDKTLSPLAKSAEITVKNSSVTLNGSVNNNDEKNRIASIARQIDGVKSVSNNLNITNR